MFSLKPELDQLTLEKLQNRFGDAIISYEMIVDVLSITIEKKHSIEIIEFLYKDENLHFQFLTSLNGMHFPGLEKEIAVFYHLHSLSNNHRIRLKVFSTLEDIHYPTATGIFPAANWMERETYDFFGILFDGHPNLKRILNCDDFQGFPLRKDFPLEDQTREDKNDRMFGR